ncbi:caspase family protein [Azospirillum sp.]|uniref:caspase family protein n=1 Tax=Azospirillum sp. TaxID=34012 RepID=UPI0026246AB4|nr:caspase family protein [Azospirillum sp.]
MRAAELIQQLTVGCAAALMMMLAAGVMPALARPTALLVGVSAYPSLPDHLQLRGPANDVGLMRGVARDLGIRDEDTLILANNGVPGAAPPTRAAILSALDRIARKVEAGDGVLVFLAGHGARQPARTEDAAPRSSDGFDALFLPEDAKSWRESDRVVENAIASRELQQRMDAIRARGAFVWLVVDACHSSYLVRGGALSVAGEAARGVDGRDLGLPATAIEEAERQGIATRGPPWGGLMPPPAGGAATDERTGGYVAFFAAQSNERTPEYEPPGGEGLRYGLFTHHLVQAFQAGRDASFGQLGERVLQQYARRGRQVPTPVFIGPGLDRSWTGPVAARRQWLLARDGDGRVTVPAGTVQEFGVGTLLAVLPSTSAPDGAAVGHVRVTASEPFVSTVEPVEYGGKPAPNPAGLQGAAVHVVSSVLPADIRAALPQEVGGADPGAGRIRDILTPLALPWIRWEADRPIDADVRLVAEDGRLWFVPAGQALVKAGSAAAGSISITGGDGDIRAAAASALERIAKALRLVRLTNAIQNGAELAGVSLSLDLIPARAPNTMEPVALPTPALPVEDGDRPVLTIRNKGDSAVDVSILYLDARFGLTPAFPENGRNNRLTARTGVLRFDGLTLSATAPATVGRERILVFAVEVGPQQPRLDLSFLAQPALTAPRTIPGNPLRLFQDTGFPLPDGRGPEIGDGGRYWSRIIELNLQASP